VFLDDEFILTIPIIFCLDLLSKKFSEHNFVVYKNKNGNLLNKKIKSKNNKNEQNTRH